MDTFVLMNQQGEYACEQGHYGHGGDTPSLGFTKDLDQATVFNRNKIGAMVRATRSMSGANSMEQELASYIRVPAYEVRSVKLGEQKVQSVIKDELVYDKLVTQEPVRDKEIKFETMDGAPWHKHPYQNKVTVHIRKDKSGTAKIVAVEEKKRYYKVKEPLKAVYCTLSKKMLDDARKGQGKKPYNEPGNFLVGDGYFAQDRINTYGKDRWEAACEIVSKYEGYNVYHVAKLD